MIFMNRQELCIMAKRISQHLSQRRFTLAIFMLRRPVVQNSKTAVTKVFTKILSLDFGQLKCIIRCYVNKRRFKQFIWIEKKMSINFRINIRITVYRFHKVYRCTFQPVRGLQLRAPRSGNIHKSFYLLLVTRILNNHSLELTCIKVLKRDHLVFHRNLFLRLTGCSHLNVKTFGEINIHIHIGFQLSCEFIGCHRTHYFQHLNPFCLNLSCWLTLSNFLFLHDSLFNSLFLKLKCFLHSRTTNDEFHSRRPDNSHLSLFKHEVCTNRRMQWHRYNKT